MAKIPSRSSLTIVLLAYWLACFVATHLPIRQVESPLFNNPGADKIVHFGLYFLLAFSLAFFLNRSRHPLLPSQRFGRLVLVVLVCAGYGIFDELTQNFVPTRSADVLDWIADLMGAIAGAAGAIVLGVIVYWKGAGKHRPN